MRRGTGIPALVVAAGVAAQAGALWLDVPFVRQVENGCGAAVLSMTLQYWQRQGAPVDAEAADAAAIQRQLYSAEAHGILASALQRYLEEHGFRALVFPGAWSDLAEHLAKGRPLIVGMRAGGESHYVVVAGLGENTVEVNDPADRKLRKISRADFEKKWRAAGNWTLLAVPRAVF